MANPIQELADALSKLPGIGPRQSKRIVYHLLTQDPDALDVLAEKIVDLKQAVNTCISCRRFFQPRSTMTSNLCSICADQSRDASLLMVVGRDIDLDNMEKTREWNGLYFVLGGLIPILEKEPGKKIREGEFLSLTEERAKSGVLKEIVFALNANPEGENTEDYLRRRLAPLAEKYAVRQTELGRGLSTGSELEYADAATLKNALKNRK